MQIEPRTRFRAAPKGRGRTVLAVLPNGRVAWLRLSPSLASVAATNDLLRRAERATDRNSLQLADQAARLDRLSGRVNGDVERLSQLRLEKTRRLRRRLTADHARLDRKLTAATIAARTAVQEQQKQLGEIARRLGRRDLWDKITLAVSLPLFSAYGEEGSPFSANNLALTLSLLVWVAGDEAAQALFGGKEDEPDSFRDPDVWSYLAPAGCLLTGWWLMHNRQHDRFVASIAGLAPGGSGAPATAVRATFGATARAAAPEPAAPAFARASTARTSAETVQPAPASPLAVTPPPSAVVTPATSSARSRRRARARAAESSALVLEPGSTAPDVPIVPEATSLSDAPGSGVPTSELPPPVATLVLEASVDLTPFIAPDYLEDFASFSEVPAVAGLTRLALSADVPADAVHVETLTAAVDGLELRLTVTMAITPDTNVDPKRLLSAITALDVAWIVDTSDRSGPARS